MSTSEKIKEKIKNFKHKEIIFFVIFIILVVTLWFLIKAPTTTTSTVSYSDMSVKDELTYRITDAVNAMTGDTQSKIIIYWNTNESNDDNSFSSIFNNSATNDGEASIAGIAVVCKNGDNAEIKVKITFMLSKVFDINADRISVYGKI